MPVLCCNQSTSRANLCRPPCHAQGIIALHRPCNTLLAHTRCIRSAVSLHLIKNALCAGNSILNPNVGPATWKGFKGNKGQCQGDPGAFTPGVCSESDKDAGGPGVELCSNFVTFSEAKFFCESKMQARLCTSEELKHSCAESTGCDYDYTWIWSSTPCTASAALGGGQGRLVGPGDMKKWNSRAYTCKSSDAITDCCPTKIDRNCQTLPFTSNATGGDSGPFGGVGVGMPNTVDCIECK